MRSNPNRTSPMGSPPSSSKKSPSSKVPILIRTRSFHTHSKLLSSEHPPAFSSRPSLLPPLPKLASPFKLPPLYADHSPLAESLRLPKTDPPSPVRHYTIKKRFAGMGDRLDRIPSEDWLSAMLYCTPEFSRVLATNLDRCKEKLARSKLVRAAILEEDGDVSDLSLRNFLEERASE